MMEYANMVFFRKTFIKILLVVILAIKDSIPLDSESLLNIWRLSVEEEVLMGTEALLSKARCSSNF